MHDFNVCAFRVSRQAWALIQNTRSVRFETHSTEVAARPNSPATSLQRSTFVTGCSLLPAVAFVVVLTILLVAAGHFVLLGLLSLLSHLVHRWRF